MFTKSEGLNRAIDKLIKFLSLTHVDYWVKTLSEIKTELNQPGKTADTLKAPGNYFRGMGSLNDRYIGKENNNVPQGHTAIEANIKLDRLFKECKLISLSPLYRILWKILEFKHKNDPPPSIKNAFKK